MRARGRLAGVALGAATGVGAASAHAYCPCYTLSSPSNDHDCGVEAAPGTNPTAAEWQPIFDLVSKGPSAWGNQGPSVEDIGQGCGKPEAHHTVPARFPCELLKAIAMTESSWKQFCVPDTPADQVGGPERTIISFDCGYGIAQVTSGMHGGETPDFDRSKVASDPTYNLATGTRILASKWKATECVGDNQPKVIEHWYSATWAYNGLAYVNNPNNPNYDPSRGVWDPQVGGAAPYQEKVFGRMEHTGGKWVETAVAYPNPGDIGTGSKPPELPEPSCASPTDCNGKRETHVTSCDGEVGGGGGGGAGGSVPAGGSGGAAGSPTTGGTTGSGGSLPIDTGGAGGQSTLDPVGVPGSDAGCACRRGRVGDRPSGPAASLIVLLGTGLRRSRRHARPR